MASTPATNAIGVELQAAGENLNTWGDTKLNNALQILANIGVKWNDLTIDAGATTTISETNFATTNDTEVATIKLVAGTIAAAFNLVLPGRDKRLLIWNNTGYAATIKLSATAGFSLPTGRIALVATDGSTDVYNMSPNFVGTGYTVTNSGDVTNKSYVDTAIATASLPATAGTWLVSGADTTAGYGSTKINATGTGAATVTQSIGSAGGNETVNIAVSVGALGLAAGSNQTGSFAAASNTKYVCNFSAAATITLPAAPSTGDLIEFTLGGNQIVTLNPNGLKVNASTSNFVLPAGRYTIVIGYTGATDGWV